MRYSGQDYIRLIAAGCVLELAYNRFVYLGHGTLSCLRQPLRHWGGQHAANSTIRYSTALSPASSGALAAGATAAGFFPAFMT